MLKQSTPTTPTWAIEKQTPIGFGLAAVIVIVVVALSFVSVRSLIETNDLVTHTHEVLQALENTRLLLVQAETGGRGYVITGNETFLEPYTQSANAIDGRMNDLRAMTADNPTQQERLVPLGLLVRRRYAQIENFIDARRMGEVETAQSLITFGGGQVVMNEANAILDQMVNEENRLLMPRVAAADASARSTLIMLLLLSVLALGILGAVYLLIWRAIAGRKRLESALDAERGLLRTLVDTLPDLIFVKKPDGAFLLNNRAYAARVGLQGPEDLVGKTDFDIFPYEMAASFRQDELALIESGKPLIDHEEPFVGAGGERQVMLVSKIPLRNEAGQVERIVGIGHDITERKRFEERIQMLNASLQKRTEQVEVVNKELEAFSYTISHDLRAPLRAVSGFSRILLEDYAPHLPEEAARYLRLASENAQQMGELIDDLLLFSRLGRQAIHREPVDVNALVQQAWSQLMEQDGERNVALIQGDLPGCEADRSLLRQVFLNLLANALKFTVKREQARVEVGCRQEHGEVVYFVRDNGAGFDMQYVHKLFGVFQRLHRAEDYEGTGVGLAIVQRIILRHGGKVWAEGQVDQGATFYFTVGSGASEEMA